MPAFKDFPALLPNDYVYIREAGKYYKVIAVEPLPAIEYDFGAISAGSKKEDVEITELYLDTNQLAQYRILIQTPDVELYIKQPPATTRGTTKTAAAKIIKLHADAFDVLGHLTEFWVFEDKPVKFTAVNAGSSDLTEAKVLFVGWKYLLEEVTETPERYSVISIEAIGARK